jgi:tRNA (cytidine/uridine-2'-O-)-methyltransferase
MIRMAFVHPEIPQNVGALIRLSACWNVPLDLIEPFSFVWDLRRLKQTALDYALYAPITRYTSWNHYLLRWPKQRKIFLIPRQGVAFSEFVFLPTDTLMLGSEHAGFTSEILQNIKSSPHAHCVYIPLCTHTRSLNVTMAAAIVLSEALRQTQQWPS